MKFGPQPADCKEKLPSPANLDVCRIAFRKSILNAMPRRVHNWSYRDVTKFLKDNGFEFHEYLAGSHQRWILFGKDGEIQRKVEINVTRTAYKVKMLLRMIRQSGIPQSEWIRWTKGREYGGAEYGRTT